MKRVLFLKSSVNLSEMYCYDKITIFFYNKCVRYGQYGHLIRMNNVKWSSDKARKKMSCLSSKPASNFRVKTKQKSKRDHFLTWPFLFKKDKLCNEFLINKYYVSLFFHIRINYFLLWKGSLDTKHCPCFSFPWSIKKTIIKTEK